jgi:hypothetical protein
MNNGGYGSVSQYSFPNDRGLAYFNFKTNGQLSMFDTEGWNNQEEIWDKPGAPDASDIQIKAEIVSATQGTWIGTMSTWLAFTTNREWSFRTGLGESGNGVLGIKIRHSPTTIELDSFDLSSDITYV